MDLTQLSKQLGEARQQLSRMENKIALTNATQQSMFEGSQVNMFDATVKRDEAIKVLKPLRDYVAKLERQLSGYLNEQDNTNNDTQPSLF